jgi:molybdopterin-guanine dinucleotide biosynthesis protein A
MTGIVLSGGENRRMGRDKAFLPIAGRPIIEHVLQALRDSVEHIIIVTNSPEAYSSYEAEVMVIEDVYEKRGPLTGIYSGLLRSSDEYNVVVACDMPFLNPRLLAYLADLSKSYDVVLPKIEDYVEPLHAVYRRGLLPIIEEHLNRENRRIQSILSGLRVRYVTEREIDRFDPQRRSFINLNTPEEYKEVTCLD